MPNVEVDGPTYERLRLAANVAHLHPGEVVARALDVLAAVCEPRVLDRWADVAVHTTYKGRRVEGRFLPATRRLVITTGPLAGTSYGTPSAAAGAGIASHGSRADPRANGWRFWHVTGTGEFLDTVRITDAGRRGDAH